MRKNLFKNMSFATLAIQTVLSVALVLGMHGAVLAADSSTNGTTDTGASSASFNVSSYLTASGQKQSYLKTGNPVGSFIIEIINFLTLTIGSLSFVAIVIGGFFLMTSHGNENQLTKGKDIIKMALIGLAVALLSYVITAFVQSLFYEIPKT